MAIIKCVIRSHRTQNESNATEKISTTVAIIDAGGFFPQQCTTRMPTSNVGCLGAFEHTDASPTPLPLCQQLFCTIHYLSEIYYSISAMTGGPSELGGGGGLVAANHPPVSGPSAPSLIKLSNGMVLYLRQVNRYLALVCLMRVVWRAPASLPFSSLPPPVPCNLMADEGVSWSSGGQLDLVCVGRRGAVSGGS